MKPSDVTENKDDLSSLIVRIGDAQSGMRLDQALAELLVDFSRSRLQQWIRQGRVLVEGRTCRPRDKVLGGESVELRAEFDIEQECRPQPISLDIVFEDDQLLVIDKPAGLVVHPAAGNPDGTLQNALLHHSEDLMRLPRAGIVHRLDKDTSGLLVIAKTPGAHRSLVEQLQSRSVKREYRALAQGVLTAGGDLEAPIGRHPRHRTRMAVVANGKPALTRYRVLERFRAHTYIKVMLGTGRTHQIRVHMAHIGHPLFGDPVYGGRLRLPSGASDQLTDWMRGFKRQALHASRLSLVHPVSGQPVEWRVPLPADMATLLDLLRTDSR